MVRTVNNVINTRFRIAFHRIAFVFFRRNYSRVICIINIYSLSSLFSLFLPFSIDFPFTLPEKKPNVLFLDIIGSAPQVTVTFDFSYCPIVVSLLSRWRRTLRLRRDAMNERGSRSFARFAVISVQRKRRGRVEGRLFNSHLRNDIHGFVPRQAFRKFTLHRGVRERER